MKLSEEAKEYAESIYRKAFHQAAVDGESERKKIRASASPINPNISSMSDHFIDIAKRLLAAKIDSYVQAYKQDDLLIDEEDKDEIIEELKRIINTHIRWVTTDSTIREFRLPNTGELIPNIESYMTARFEQALGEAAIELDFARKQMVMDRKKKTADKEPSHYNIHIHGSNYGGIQQGGQGNIQNLIKIPEASPSSSAEQDAAEKSDIKDEKYAQNLYEQVIALSQDWKLVDEGKAQLIIEYGKDAIEAFGKTNQTKKVELRKLIDQAEQVISPDSIDTFKKRAERVVLRFVYPKNLKSRNIVLVILGVTLLLFIISLVILRVWDFKSKFNSSSSPITSKQKIVLILADVTSSLSQEGVEKVASLTADILDSLPVQTRYAVDPIMEDGDRHPPLISQTIVPEPKGMQRIILEEEKRVQRQQNEERRNKLKSAMLSLHDTSSSKQTCIINMLRLAQEQLLRMGDSETIDPTKYDYELIIISDMQDDCNDVSERKYAQSALPNLSSVRTTVILPVVPYTSRPIPANRQLKDEWQDIFRLCGTRVDWISNGELPNRFNPSLQ